jgi:hypothetical protein
MVDGSAGKLQRCSGESGVATSNAPRPRLPGVPFVEGIKGTDRGPTHTGSLPYRKCGIAYAGVKGESFHAVAHSIVVSAFHMLIRGEPYRELGAHDFDERRQAHRVDRLTRRIERLGYRVTLEPVAAA